MQMTKREQLENMRRENARDRAELREDEMYRREGEDIHIHSIREKMARILVDEEIDTEKRRANLATLKDEIETILDQRNEREHEFIAQELERHRMEQELEQEVAKEEIVAVPIDIGSRLFMPRPYVNVGAEQIRKDIEEKNAKLTEEEKFSTIIAHSGARENIPDFKSSRRKKKELENDDEPKQPMPRIDTIVIKQREIGMLYRESQDEQLRQLGKKKDEVIKETEPVEEIEHEDE